jgi:hypothetical protein
MRIFCPATVRPSSRLWVYRLFGTCSDPRGRACRPAFGAPHPIPCVLRRWPGPGPGVQATEQSRISRFGELAIRLEDQPERHGSPRRPRRSNLTILSESYSQIKFRQIEIWLGASKSAKSPWMGAVTAGAIARPRCGQMTSTVSQRQPSETPLAPSVRHGPIQNPARSAEPPPG